MTFNYQKQLELALELVLKNHSNQVDKGGNPYVEHPIWIMSNVKGQKCKITALLHDIIEDTDLTINDLKEYGFDEEIIEAVRLLTRENGVSYNEYIKRLITNPIASKVKLKDLEHNMDLTRLKEVSEKDIKRQEKYKKVHKFIEENMKEIK